MASLVDVLLATAQTQGLGELAHDLMREIERISGLDSIFLARVNRQRDRFEMLYTRNVRPTRINLHQGTTLPWSETICRQALASGERLTHAADARWPGLRVVEDLRICTYVIEPVCDDHGRLLATLCAVSAHRVPVSADTRLVMKRIAPLLARRMQHERDALAAASALDEPVASEAGADAGADGWPIVDPWLDRLTGLPARRSLEATLDRLLPAAPGHPDGVCLAMVDVLGFEAFDAWHGHWAADRMLLELANRLRAVVLAHEYLARYGDREFVVVQPLPAAHLQHARAAAELAARLLAAARARCGEGRAPMDTTRVQVDITCSHASESVLSLLYRADASLQRMRRTAAQDDAMARAVGLSGGPVPRA